MKIRNIVWLSLENQNGLEKVHEPLSELIATNEYIASSLKLVLSDPELQKRVIQQIGLERNVNLMPLTEKIIEKTIIHERLNCPFCPEDFTGKGAKYLREHILKEHSI